MQLSNIPGKLVLPFANAGGKSTIPVASQIGITAGAASLTDGFPPLTRTPIAAGGVPPSGLDMNGILYEMSAIIRWANAGGGYPFDSTFATDTNVGGYPKGARVMRSDGAGYWFNTAENNVTDPEGAGAAAAGWVPDYTTGVASVAMTGSTVTLTPAQYGKPIVLITGVLTANLNLILPTIVGEWVIINSTTGPYSITAKTVAGTGAVLMRGTPSIVIGDGVNIVGANPWQTVSVKNFGADPSASNTTNLSAIQAAIDSFPNGGYGELNFEPGAVYNIAGGLNNNNRNIIFNGKGATLNLTTSASYLLTINGSGCTVRDLFVSKNVGVAASAFYIAGIRHRFDNVQTANSIWSKVFHLQKCKESHFTKLRVDNDVTNSTGDIFYFDYSVNNTISDSMIGYANRGIYGTATPDPTYGNSNEGVTVSGLITVYCQQAVKFDKVTSLSVVNSVLDFCTTFGIFVTNGNTLFVSGNWIAGPAASGFVAIGTHVNFSSAYVSGNRLVGNGTLGTSNAFGSSATYCRYLSNDIYNLNFGAINNATSYEFGNVMSGAGTGVTGTRKGIPGRTLFGPVVDDGVTAVQIAGDLRSDGFIFQHAGIREFCLAQVGNGTNLLYSQFGDVATMGDVYVEETGTGNYLRCTFYKRNLASTPVVTTIANSGLTFSSSNVNGTFGIAGYSVPANVRYVTKFIETT